MHSSSIKIIICQDWDQPTVLHDLDMGETWEDDGSLGETMVKRQKLLTSFVLFVVPGSPGSSLT